ncbi:hypothetical protein MCOR02_009954 [Pyricularia oryzae]|uniref:Uncharacterized protein n=1 Tax=Pyricularia grisea TaxID=148305 RepID=A0ABQ8NMR6_PYRGI|nr:hypothetical protein MCOR02_009954 [Pyricularia oryzae]KAI6299493.1 hypothetical protein MCOR33_004625 [Pyricularia grisea]KAI6330609.1 hypothetical protein MCOR29_001837 [Pyricularia oryzae]KAI6348298.1 hypothetical protein MCOR28_001706 [Pyricularia oryzae]KAI6385721.1 hypothetical protein MCOR32_001379 [Pyricularia oryzae]
MDGEVGKGVTGNCEGGSTTDENCVIPCKLAESQSEIATLKPHVAPCVAVRLGVTWTLVWPGFVLDRLSINALARGMDPSD